MTGGGTIMQGGADPPHIHLVVFAISVLRNELGFLKLSLQESESLVICETPAFQGLTVSAWGKQRERLSGTFAL